MELNNMHIEYIDMESLVLQLPMRKLALGRATQEQQLMWEALLVLDKAQHRECNQDITCALHQICDSVLTNLHNGTAIYKGITQEVTNQVAVHITQHAIQDRAETGAGGCGARMHNMDMHTDNEQPQGGGDNDSGKVKIS